MPVNKAIANCGLRIADFCWNSQFAIRSSQFKPVFRTGRLLVLAALLLFPASVSAIPISEYQQNLKNAIASLSTLGQNEEEEESESDYENRFKQTVDSVRTALPPKQTIESDGDSVNIDNAWLHKALDELKSDDSITLGQLLERLRAIDERLTERQEATRPGESKGWAKSRLESILARPEYETGAGGPNALTRLLRDFMRWIAKLFPKRPSGDSSSLEWINVIAKIGVVIAGFVVLFFLVKLLLKRFKRRGRIKVRKKPEPRIVLGERLEPEQTATDLLSEAEELARRGELRAAIRKGYIALLVELGDRKIISLAQHKTNRDYLNALRNVPQLHSRMRGLTDSFERHWYGFAQANENDWQDFRNGYLAALQTGTN